MLTSLAILLLLVIGLQVLNYWEICQLRTAQRRALENRTELRSGRGREMLRERLAARGVVRQ